MSISVSDELLSQASAAWDSNDENSPKLVKGFLDSIRESLPEYWAIYSEYWDIYSAPCSLQSRTNKELGRISRGFASTAMQSAMAKHFGYPLVRIGDSILWEEATEEISSTDVDDLVGQYPSGYLLLDNILKDAANSDVLVDGVVWDPDPDSPEEPDESIHYELLRILSDYRSRKIWEDRNLSLSFSNCCSTFIVANDISDAGQVRQKRFTSIAAQILQQAPDRKAFCC